MQKSTITIDVLLDNNKIPEQINWKATDSSAEEAQRAKAMSVAFWDGEDKSAMRIDLWTKTMMIDEMADFYYQLLISQADTFERATRYGDLAQEMKDFAQSFLKKFKEKQEKENSLN